MQAKIWLQLPESTSHKRGLLDDQADASSFADADEQVKDVEKFELVR